MGKKTSVRVINYSWLNKYSAIVHEATHSASRHRGPSRILLSTVDSRAAQLHDDVSCCLVSPSLPCGHAVLSKTILCAATPPEQSNRQACRICCFLRLFEWRKDWGNGRFSKPQIPETNPFPVLRPGDPCEECLDVQREVRSSTACRCLEELEPQGISATGRGFASSRQEGATDRLQQSVHQRV